MLNWNAFPISLLGDNLPKAPGTTLLHARFTDRQGSLHACNKVVTGALGKLSPSGEMWNTCQFSTHE